MAKPKNITEIATTLAVVLDRDRKPGIVRCGDYEPGVEYPVEAREALRLVDVKGFRFVDPALGEATRAAIAAADAAAAAELAAADNAGNA